MPFDNGVQEFLSADEVADWPLADAPAADRKAPLLNAIIRNRLDGPAQVAGRHFAIGCVALEITQRCNLDCSACYLSELSEAVRDLPLHEILRRIDQIAEYYGPHTNVQITGGDPTLREETDLVAIVKHISAHKMRSALFTNGIKASRSLLEGLAAAGLNDVAFHVDMTQGRRGYVSEQHLNEIREDYLARARGLGLQILFNTTVCENNIEDVAMLAKFFRDHADEIHLASFQLIADTGRGVMRNRPYAVTQQSVMNRISKGVGVPLSFDMPQVGHSDCNRYAMIATAGAATAAIFTAQDQRLMETLFVAGRSLFADRHDAVSAAPRFALMLARRPKLMLRMIGYGLRKLWGLRRGLMATQGRVNRLTFYIHNFMHADQLERSRCESCVFMTMTRDGPVSMCVHNAKRDEYLLQPVDSEDGKTWRPFGGKKVKRDVIDISALPIKRLKGRARIDRLCQRSQVETL